MDLSKDVLFDKRLIDRHIRLGLITREQVEEHMSQLPDMSEAGEALDLDEIGPPSTRSPGSTSAAS